MLAKSKFLLNLQILSAVLVYVNKRNGMQSSGVLFVFWFFLFLFSIPQCRSQIRDQSTTKHNGIDNFWDDYNLVSFKIFFAITSIVFVLNCFTDQDPQETKYPKTEVSQNVLNLITATYTERS